MTSRQADGYNDVLPSRLRAIMDDRKITLVALAEKTGIKRQSIGNYKDGNNVPDANALRKIAEALNVSADYLLGLSNNEKHNDKFVFRTCADVILLIETLRRADPDNVRITYHPEEGIDNFTSTEAFEIFIKNPGILKYYREIVKVQELMKNASPELKAYEDNIRRDLLLAADDEYFGELPF